ncbi:DNA repair protein complementing XP-C cells homolog [Anopheles cruzii]|uniref:DNA repair protein complementing XP-C cells homolog n=1 Tax=Anopheles cruzii TaxID=68878 RepID=UPI0022EC5FC1|nr:DNA repair protein complementing XP-C cells homolog [Anopheles cruzii]
MSDDADDFSASEDEWLPAKSKDKKGETCTTSSGFDCEEELNEGRPKNRKTRRRIAATKRNILTATQTSKNRQSSVNRAVGKCDRYDSDSSGDEHLVDPTQLDFSSKFFDEVSAVQTQSTVDGHDVVPFFDCNAGMGQLSDSSEAESFDQAGDTIEQSHLGKQKEKRGKELISKINEMSTAYVNFQNFTRTMEMAKSNLQSAAKQQQQEQFPEASGGNAQDVSNLLALGEAKHTATEQPIPRTKPLEGGRKSKKVAESDSDWEEVEENEQASSTPVPNTVQITLNPEATTRKKRKSAEIDMEACIKRMINRDKRDDQLVLHKMTIIMGIAHGNHANRVLNDPTLLTIGNGLIPSNRCYPKGRTNLQYLEQIMTFFREIVTLKDTRVFCRSWKRLTLPQTLRLQLLSQMANCKRDFVYLFIVVLRSIGIQCRLVLSLQVAPKLVPTSELLKVPARNSGKKKKVLEDTQDNTEHDHDYSVPKNADASGCSKRKLSPVVLPQLDGADDGGKQRKRQPRKNTKQQLEKQNDDNTSTRENGTARISTIAGLRNACPEVINSPRNKGKQPLQRAPQKTDTAETQLKSEKSNNVKLVETLSPKASTSKMARRDYGKVSSPTSNFHSTNPSDIQTKRSLDGATQPWQPSPGSKIVKIERFSAKTKRALDRRVLSSDDEQNREKANADGTCKPHNEWVEAFAEEEERWIPMDVLLGKLQCVEDIVRHASSPMLYVLAWNNDGSIKDVSARYCAQYLTVTQKLRIMQPWMDNTLLQFRGERSARDIVEDRELNRILEERPLPKTIGEFKCHPYFVLKRHLLKFEAIYPPDAPTLGFTSSNEAVYARECVHTLCAREIWLKQARTVKLHETPYKIVPGRPKYDRSSAQRLPSQPLELFGLWQTEEYDPPTAEDGIVPRNAYGNVELFKPCMLPKKTVHLRLPALNRVCKKLRIDCAQAVTGFEFHAGSSRPVYDGFVVCEENRDLVVDAWHQEQEAEQLRAREKYEKRVYGNWKRLIKGLLIRQRLQNKYKFNNLSQ